jgi:peptide/nickel transport system substrate-binding protein
MYALDPYAINRAAAFGYATVARSPIPTPIEGWTPELWPYKVDPVKAKNLLAEAGYPNGFKTELYFNAGNAEREQTAIAAQSQLRKVGIEIEIRSIPWPTFVTNYQDGTMPMFTVNALSLPVAEDFLLSNYHSKNHGARGNFAFYTNTDVDKMIDTLVTTTDPAKRREILRALQRQIADDAPVGWVYNALLLFAQRRWVKGWVLFPSSNWYFYPVSKSL